MRRSLRPSPLNVLKRYLPKNAEDASALILTLLVIVLLSAIVTSFLSSARTEQTATRNYTSKVQAEMFANSATQQAMAKIQQGFTVGTGNTTVITTQPGAIKKYFFSNGTLQTSSTITTELFTTGSGNLTNLNNLQNPGNSTSNATSNQWTITGNVSEQINVPMENITSNGTIVGRIAYYVDDEGTKLNLNAATGDRTTLNAAIRPSDIGALSASDTNIFASIVNGTASNNTSNATTWSHFFRSEQVGAAINSAGGNFSQENLPYITTATTSASSTANITHLLTPWGTQRVSINTLSTNATDGTGDTSVISIFEAFTGLNGTSVNTPSNSTYGITGQGLQNIFGGDFSTKYTSLGVKQIAANMLQMRSPNTSSVNQSFSFNGTLLGSGDFVGANYSVNAIPMDYMGYAPYPVISEVSVAAGYYIETVGTTPYKAGFVRPSLQVMVELYNPYGFTFNSTDARIVIKMNAFTFNCTHRILSANQTFGPFTYGPSGNYSDDSSPQAWGSGNDYLNNNTPLLDPNNRAKWNAVARDNSQTPGKLKESYFSADNPMSYPNFRGSPIAGPSRIEIPPYSKVQFHLFSPNWGVYGQVDATSAWGTAGASVIYNNTDVQIVRLDNLSIDFSYVKLLANKSDASSVRDWVRGPEIGPFSPEIRNQFGNGTVSRNISTSQTKNNNISPGKYSPPVSPNTYQRISPLLKTTVNATASLSDATRAWTNTISTNTTHSLISLASANTTNHTLGNSTNPELFNYTQSNPSFAQGNPIPSDPSYNNYVANAVFAGSNASDMREPYLVTGNYTGPADLGFVPTNQRWRRLRMQMQPTQEVSNSDGGNGNQTYIPDWAMLDVISFGNSTNANDPFTRQHPVNINGRFYLPGNVANSSPPAPRTMGLRALAKVLEISTGGTIQDPMNPASSNFTDTMRFRGNTINATMVVNNIRNMSWSTSSTWGNRRSNKNFPADQYILPSEIMEIAGVANEVDQTNYTNNSTHFKWNEGRASALIPAVTTRSSFFTIFAYAQALDKQGNIDSEALTKTLVEVEIVTAATSNGTTTTPAQYKVKKLYTQPILMGD